MQLIKYKHISLNEFKKFSLGESVNFIHNTGLEINLRKAVITGFNKNLTTISVWHDDTVIWLTHYDIIKDEDITIDLQIDIKHTQMQYNQQRINVIKQYIQNKQKELKLYIQNTRFISAEIAELERYK